MDNYECPRCEGAGEYPSNDGYNGFYLRECEICNGSGKVCKEIFYDEVQREMDKMLRKPIFEKMRENTSDDEILNLFEDTLKG